MKIPQLQHQIKTSQPNHWKNNWMNGFPWFMESNQINIIKTPNSNSLYTLPLVMYLYTYQISLESVIIEIRIHSSITFISLFSCWYENLAAQNNVHRRTQTFYSILSPTLQQFQSNYLPQDPYSGNPKSYIDWKPQYWASHHKLRKTSPWSHRLSWKQIKKCWKTAVGAEWWITHIMASW